MEVRTIEREEIEKVREMNRREEVKHIYYYRHGDLELEEEYYDIKGWIPSELESIIEDLYNTFDEGGYLVGTFDGEKMAGIVALGNTFFGSSENTLQLVFLHVDKEYRKKGIGTKLMEKAIEKARERGAEKVYVSATPSKNTVEFYSNLGFELTSELNPELYEKEPEDIHLELDV